MILKYYALVLKHGDNDTLLVTFPELPGAALCTNKGGGSDG
jgi:hypothetical protein